jgi:MFS family permease
VALLIVAIIAMLAQQTFATAAKAGVPVLFKPVADEIGFSAELVLLYTWVFACVGILVMLGCGAFITRFGALRMTQVGCVLMALGLAGLATVTAPAWMALTGLCAVAGAISMGATLSTPASSQILARYAPLRWAPLVFSIKQTGVPAGIVVASFAAPYLSAEYGWRGAGLILAGGCIAIAIALQPCRREFDQDRKPKHPLTIASLRTTFLAVLNTPSLRDLAMAAFAFIGLQAIYTNFTVVYLAEELHYDLAQAGATLGFATLVAAPGRIFWGWVSSVWVTPRTLLIYLAIAMSIGCAAMGLYSESWSYWAIMTPLVVVSATALSWHGVLLSEIARLAPPGEVGRMTGGVLAFGTAGQIAFPIIFGLGYWLGDYIGAFLAVSLPAFATALIMLRKGPANDSHCAGDT